VLAPVASAMQSAEMSLSIASWNINSVRLRIGLVEKLLREKAPDILCLQETKCPQGQFPSASLKKLGYEYLAEFGQKGYHGVAIVSRIPFKEQHSRDFCLKGDCRHVAAQFEGKTPFVLHNLYVPAGGDEPDPKINEKFDHKLKFVAEMEEWSRDHAKPDGFEAVAVGDFNIAPLETDVWGHKELLKVVSHTPIETNALKRIIKAGNWVDVMREHVPPEEKLYTWWSYRAKDWEASNRGRRLDHVWATPGLAKTSTRIEVLKDARGWTQPSDHVPVIAHFDITV
jgi:exodeoxyribonuclease III